MSFFLRIYILVNDTLSHSVDLNQFADFYSGCFVLLKSLRTSFTFNVILFSLFVSLLVCLLFCCCFLGVFFFLSDHVWCRFFVCLLLLLLFFGGRQGCRQGGGEGPLTSC